jgi:hypothetical protein
VTPALYLAGVDKIVQALLSLILPALRLLFRPGLGDEGIRRRRVNVATASILTAVRAARSAVAVLTADYMRDQAEEQAGVSDPYIPPLAGYSEAAVRTSLETAIDKHLDNPQQTRQQAVDAAAATFVRHTRAAGRQMIVDAVEPEDEDDPDDSLEDEIRDAEPEQEPDAEPADDDEPADLPEPDEVPDVEEKPRETATDPRRAVAYARGLTGADNCAFCVMLASRGAIYKSAVSARFSESGGKYHDHCDCVPIIVYTSRDWPGKGEAERLYDLWLDATAGFFQRDAINALRRELARKERAGEVLYPGFKPMRAA